MRIIEKKMQEERQILMPYLKDARQKGYKAVLVVNNEVFGVHYLIPKSEEVAGIREGKQAMKERWLGEDTLRP